MGWRGGISNENSLRMTISGFCWLYCYCLGVLSNLFLFTEAKKICPLHCRTSWADGVENNFAWLLKAGKGLLIFHSAVSCGARSGP